MSATLLFATISFAASVGDSPCHTAIEQYRASVNGDPTAVQQHCSPEVQKAIFEDATLTRAEMTCPDAVIAFRRNQIAATDLSNFCPANVVTEISGAQQQWQPQTATVQTPTQATTPTIAGAPSVATSGQALLLTTEQIVIRPFISEEKNAESALRRIGEQELLRQTWHVAGKVPVGRGYGAFGSAVSTGIGLMRGATSRDKDGYEFSYLPQQRSRTRVVPGHIQVVVPKGYGALQLVRVEQKNQMRLISARKGKIDKDGRFTSSAGTQDDPTPLTGIPYTDGSVRYEIDATVNESFALVGSGVAYTFSVH